jgi:Reverse transcriptase (RNA-dependent DNA polymerase)
MPCKPRLKRLKGMRYEQWVICHLIKQLLVVSGYIVSNIILMVLFNVTKARLVALGNRQVQGVDFTETFAPVAKMISVHVFLTVVAIKNWELYQTDVHNAFLHENLLKKSQPSQVCHMRKSLYGFRQAPRMWLSKLTEALKKYEFVQSKTDYTLFMCFIGNAFLAILVYVDDLIIIDNDGEAIRRFKKYLSSTFHMKDLSILKYFLSIEIVRALAGMFLYQHKYTLDILAECGVLGAKPVATLIEQDHRLTESTDTLLSDPERYRRLVGRLINLTITWPDYLCYSVHVLAQFMQAPHQARYTTALRVLCHLNGNSGQGLLLQAGASTKWLL